MIQELSDWAVAVVGWARVGIWLPRKVGIRYRSSDGIDQWRIGTDSELICVFKILVECALDQRS